MRPLYLIAVLVTLCVLPVACHRGDTAADHRMGHITRGDDSSSSKDAAGNMVLGSRKSSYPLSLTDLPDTLQTNIAGFDVSHWDGAINWQQLRPPEGVCFVYIKATEGADYVDPSFATNWAGVGNTLLHRGAYHYFMGRQSEAQQMLHAQHFINTVKTLEDGDMAPMVDVEEDPDIRPELFQARLLVFIKEIASYFKTSPLIYTNKEMYKKYLSLHNSFQPYEMWIADYSYALPELCDKKSPRIWQFTDKGTIKGIPNQVDMDLFYKTTEDLKKLFVKK
jgi:lysozyme